MEIARNSEGVCVCEITLVQGNFGILSLKILYSKLCNLVLLTLQNLCLCGIWNYYDRDG